MHPIPLPVPFRQEYLASPARGSCPPSAAPPVPGVPPPPRTGATTGGGGTSRTRGRTGGEGNLPSALERPQPLQRVVDVLLVDHRPHVRLLAQRPDLVPPFHDRFQRRHVQPPTRIDA